MTNALPNYLLDPTHKLVTCPQEFGWKAALNLNFVPNSFCKPPQKLEVNRGSLSETMDIGTPCNIIISFIKSCPSFQNLLVLFIGKKCTDLVNWSIITHIESQRFLEQGNPLKKKSMVICSHFHYGVGRLKRPNNSLMFNLHLLIY